MLSGGGIDDDDDEDEARSCVSVRFKAKIEPKDKAMESLPAAGPEASPFAEDPRLVVDVVVLEVGLD